MKEFGQNALSFLKTYGIRLAIAMVVFIVGIFLVKFIIAIMKKLLKKSKVDGSASNLIIQLSKVILWIALLLGVLSVAGIKISGIVAIIGAVTVSLGIALQGSLGNLASGIVIASTKPFKEGQFIEVNNIQGTVKTINFFTTELVTIDNKKIIVPNNTITNSGVINYNDQALRMINFNIPISYESDLRQVQSMLQQLLESHEGVLKVPIPTIRLENFGASAIELNLRCWVKSNEYKATFWDINEMIFDLFKRENIVIPYQQIDLSIKELGDNNNPKLLESFVNTQKSNENIDNENNSNDSFFIKRNE